MLVGLNISKRFGESQGLEPVSIEAVPGSVTAVIGPSGAGKSTLIRALSLVDPPDNGQVCIDNIWYRFPSNSDGLKPVPWPRLTVVFQQLFLWPHLSIGRNIFMPLELSLPQASLGLAEELSDFFGLRQCLERKPYEVSVGQRQRAAIVRALALRPKYLLLDEVTSALDVEHIERLGTAMRTAAGGGAGIILVTHLLGFAKAIADQYVFMESGRIIEKGDVESLRKPKSERVRQFMKLA